MVGFVIGLVVGEVSIEGSGGEVYIRVFVVGYLNCSGLII